MILSKQYCYSFRFLALTYLLTIVFLLVWLLSLYGLIDFTFWAIINAYTEFGVGSALLVTAIAWLIWIGVSAFAGTIVLGLILLFSHLEIRDTGFRLRTILGTSQWFDWQAIRKARPSPFGQKLWMIGVCRLGWPYWSVGLLFGLGSPGFAISGSIEDYQELIHFFREKRPDLFR